MYTMKKEHIFWTTVCLFLVHTPTPLNARSKEKEELRHITGTEMTPVKPVNSFCALKADNGPCRGMLLRYFFNTETQKCEEFFYGGCDGNKNRFETLEECKEKCAEGYQILTKTTLQKEKPPFCFFAKDPGICRGSFQRYFYDSQSKECESFTYGGCRGNLNNFETFEECARTCKDGDNDVKTLPYKENTDSSLLQPTKSLSSVDTVFPPLKLVNSFCALKADSGPCRAMLIRYFFNIQTQQCEEFVYGGCEGNENQFETMEECKEKCTGGYQKFIQGILQKEKPFFCFLEEDPGVCRGYFPKYYYNNQSQKCQRFIYGGCLGNLNNFDSLELCKSTCEDAANDSQTPSYTMKNYSSTPQPTKFPRIFEYNNPSWCLSPSDRGICHANETRFYYNSYYKKCLPFKYSGCGGNENNFTSKRACIRACKKGFIRKINKGGLIKTKRKRKQSKVKIVFEEVPVKKT